MKTVFISIFIVLIFAGCACRPVYKNVYIPVKSNEKMPEKPENDNSFEAHKAKMIYLLKCEDIAKSCTKE